MDRNGAEISEIFNSCQYQLKGTLVNKISDLDPQTQLRNAVIEHLNSLTEVFSKNLVCEDKFNVLKDTVKGQGKNETKREDTLNGKGLIERIGGPEKSLKSRIQLDQELTEKAEVWEETVKALENILKGQGKHEIQDEGTSSGKSMAERVGKLENDFHSLIQLFQRLNEEVEVWKAKVQNLEMIRTRNEDAERAVEGFKVELDLRERLDKVVTRFQNRLPVFVGFLGVVYTITFPCEMRKIFAFLIALSCMGIILEGGLATFHFRAINKEVMRLEDLYINLNTKKKGGSRSQANIGLPLSGESRTGESTLDNNVGLENGENCHQFSTFWWYAWPHVIDTIVMLIFALAFVFIFGIFIYAEKCVKHPILPTPTPVSSDDMLFPIA